MAGRLIDGIRYLGLMNDNELKSKSLEDNVYFTLRDIFWNADCDDCMSANHYNGLLTNDVSFEERGENFKYANILYDHNSDYTKKLYNFICRIIKYKNTIFDFQELSVIDEDNSKQKYIKYDEWLEQVYDLRQKLEEILEKHDKYKADDIQRDCGM